MIDYYKLLGVHPSADVETIKSAYLKKAVSCHPDRGGSHRAMLLVNKAWDVLSSPAIRRRYDRALATARQRATEEARHERAKPKGDPVQGFGFYNFWKRDFVNAGFHTQEPAWYEIPFSSESISAIVFVALGVVCSWTVLPWLFYAPPVDSWLQWPTAFVYLWIGARVGQHLHNVIARNCGFIG